VHSFESLTDKVYFNYGRFLISTVLILGVLFYRNIWLGTAMLVWIIVALILNTIFSKYKYKYDLAGSLADSANTAILADTITNNVNVKLFCGYGREADRFAESADRVRKLRAKSWNLMEVFLAINGILMVSLEIGIMYFAVMLWRRGLLTIGDFALIQAYILSLIQNVWQFGHLIQKTYEDFANAEEMTEVFNTPLEIADAKNAKDMAIKNGEIDFVDVSFCYNETRYILQNFNLEIKPKEKIALVGPSGAGKTTVARLILRMNDVSGGKILIDGQKISKVTLNSLWQSVGLVPQEPMLFHRSLFDNIRYGRPDATVDEVVAAAKMANCHDFISGFPEGYETKVGERGVKLSGGERQRVAIARAILFNNPILILDEATSSLDSESEHLIQEALDNLMKEKTVVVVAHRLSTIMKMDRIIVMNEGDIIEQGTHSALLKNKNGLYRRLWEIQAGGFIE
jgi:ATP-binding cassette subfamily B protein